MSIQKVRVKPAKLHSYQIMHLGSARMVLEACQILRDQLSEIRATDQRPSREQLQKLQLYAARIGEAVRRCDPACKFILAHGRPVADAETFIDLQRKIAPSMANLPLSRPWESSAR